MNVTIPGTGTHRVLLSASMNTNGSATCSIQGVVQVDGTIPPLFGNPSDVFPPLKATGGDQTPSRTAVVPMTAGNHAITIMADNLLGGTNCSTITFGSLTVVDLGP